MSTGTAGYSKFKASTGTSNIKAKASNIKIPGLFVDTINFQPITFILDNLSRPPIWLKQKFFRSSLPSKIVFSSIEIISHNPNSNPSHT
jgi:hypothetical protein